MFDLGFSEILVIIIVAVLVIGPKDMPHAMRTAGRWIGKVRKVSGHFRTGIDAMVREAELEDMEKKWKAQNEEIMRRSAGLDPASAEAAVSAKTPEPAMTGPPAQGGAPSVAAQPATPTPATPKSTAPESTGEAVDDVQPAPAPDGTPREGKRAGRGE